MGRVKEAGAPYAYRVELYRGGERRRKRVTVEFRKDPGLQADRLVKIEVLEEDARSLEEVQGRITFPQDWLPTIFERLTRIAAEE